MNEPTWNEEEDGPSDAERTDHETDLAGAFDEPNGNPDGKGNQGKGNGEVDKLPPGMA